jgi:hypothetical protein
VINKFGNKLLYFGVVEDRLDSLFLGRCKVRIVGVHSDNKTELPTSDLPWAFPLQSITSAAMSGIGQSPLGPVEGTWVAVTFNDDALQQPIILGTLGGIPIAQDAKADDIEDFLFNSVQPQAKANSTLPENVVTDGSGQPISTGSGGLLVTESELVVGPLNRQEVNKLKSEIAKKESGGWKDPYQAVEKKHGNYLGKYQIGSAVLANPENGYITKAGWQKYGVAAVSHPDAWSGKDGIKSKQDFLNAGPVQEKVMDANLQRIHRTLKTGTPQITPDTPKERVAGALAAAHLTGTVGARKVLNGGDAVDGNGTSASSYFKMGQAAISGVESKETVTAENFNQPQADKQYENKSGNPHPAAKYDVNNLPIVQNRIKTKGTKRDVGFTDPNKKYPKESWLKEPDTHRLARHQSISKTVVPSKEQEREKNLNIANSANVWEQPLSPYNAQYPFNHVMESESGHIIEIDDTDDRERIHIYHKSGTFIEIDHNGTITKRTKGNDVSIIEKDGRTHILGTGILTIDGDFSTHIKKSLQIQVLGDAQIHVSGNLTQQVDGDYDCNVGGNIKMTAAGSINLKGGSLLAGDASIIHWNSGQAATAAKVTNFSPTLIDPTVNTRQSSNDFQFESFTEAEKEYIVREKIESNNTVDEPAVPPKKDETAVPIKEIYAATCEDLVKPYTASTQLSLNFKLGQLCKGGVPPENGQHGLTQDQIVCNLKQLCLNVLEPLKTKYGADLVFNSGFRITGTIKSAAASKKTSQHELGMAIDVSFASANSSPNKKSMMFDKATEIKQLVPFDQLIYESMGPGSAWIHISFDKNGGRKQVLTMNIVNGKAKYTQGLSLA